MKKFEILEHTADLKIKVFGETKEKLFLNAVLVMVESLKPAVKKIHDRRFFTQLRNRAIKRKIKIISADLETLLVDFLSEILYLIQTNKEVYNKIVFKKFSDTKIEAELFGDKAESFGEDIKAVTYHNLKVEQKPNNGWEAVLLFDI